VKQTHALILLAALALAGCASPPVNRDPAIPLTAKTDVDLARYLGLWFEIARFPNSFETDCVGVTAQYAKNRDGSIKVLNSCRKERLDGPTDVAEGRARVVADGKLSVSFFWPFEGDYWILEVADDYSWALVGEPSGRYLWVLARQAHLSTELVATLESKLKAKGYNTAALYWTPQP